ncbi:Putative polyol transporter 1 [Linum perenne]
MKSEMFAFIAAVSFFTIGFDSFTFRVWVKMMDSHLIISSFSSHVMILIDNSAAICSSLMAGAWANYFGRKYLLTAMSMLLFVGNLLKGFGMSSYSLLIIGHIASGLGIGLNYTITPIYIAELVPSPARGFFTCAVEVLSNAGMLAGFICHIMLSSAFPAQAALVTLLRINAIFSILLIISILIIPESPYWLLMNGNPNNRANEILENSKRNQTEKDHIITAMQQAAAATSNPQHGLLAKLKKGLFLLLNKDFLQPPLRPILFSVCGLHIIRQLFGVNIYMADILSMFPHFTKKYKVMLANGAILLVRVVSAVVSCLIVDMRGRRTLLFVGITVTCCFLMMLGLPLLALQLNLIHVSDTINTAAAGANNEIVVITVCLLGILGIVGSFDIALGPVTWVYTAEAFDYMSRTQGSSYAVVCNRIADTIFFLSISHLEGWIKIGGVSLVFVVLMAGGLVFCTRFVIEKSRQVLK